MTVQQPVQRLPDILPGKKRTSALVRVLASLLGWGVLFGLLLAAALTWSYMAYTAPGPLTEQKIVILKPNAGRGEIAAKLQDEGVISDARIMSMASLAQSFRGASLKPGEYAFPASASMADVFNIIASGKVVIHKLTVPEGWTSAKAVARIRAHPALSGEVKDIPPEGAVIANTFNFARGKNRQVLLNEMIQAQTKLVDQVWATRKPDSIIMSKEAMVTLASIVEKETAKAEERPRVAAVFLNRLKAGMRLQSDPTIIYGIAGGIGRLDRPLTRKDIDTPTPYNTYTINGLPPGPIASPGRDAMEAVLNPAPTADLYFVADGTGGHVFAETLDQHNENVKKWREIEAQGGIVQAQADTTDIAEAKEEQELQAIRKIIQPALPDVEVPQPAVSPGATEPENAAVGEAVETLGQTEAVPDPVADATTPEPAVAPAANQQASAAGVTPAESAEVIELKPGTVMVFGDKKIPIPALKKTP